MRTFNKFLFWLNLGLVFYWLVCLYGAASAGVWWKILWYSTFLIISGYATRECRKTEGICREIDRLRDERAGEALSEIGINLPKENKK